MGIVPCPQRPEDNVVAPELGVTGGYEMPVNAGN